MSRVLLVEPDYPIPSKSRNHRNFLPIGLLKIAAYLRDCGYQIRLARGMLRDVDGQSEIDGFNPEEIWVTSLFTYWIGYVREAIQYYREKFPSAHVKVGGVCASLLSPEEMKKRTGCDEVHQGVIPEVEEHARSHPPAYELLGSANPHPIDFQIAHASRGCPRRCPFCGTWKIEPEFKPKRSIRGEIWLPGVVFYDNNFLMNPYIENVLHELADLRRDGRVRWVESQSGLDGRLLLERPHLAAMMKEAGFRYPRIAWDWGYDQRRGVERQIKVLVEAGCRPRDISVFMLYNHGIPFEEMEAKRIVCWEWGVQIADCRFRPLDQLVDDYRPWALGQTSNDYFISEGWSDALVKQFRRNVRRQNICVRMRCPIYSAAAERRRMGKEALSELRGLGTVEEKRAFLETAGADWWIPGRVSYPNRIKGALDC